MNKEKKSKIIIAVLSVSLLLVAGPSIADKVKLNPIKPTSKVALTDEQQGILAVRSVKASVVNIIGTAKPVTVSSTSPLIVTQDTGTVSGTGFVLEAGGLIVTNNHVVEDDSLNYTVVFVDGTEYPATILGKDKFDDVALIKIDAQNLVPVTLGNSDALETGQTVFAIGNSLGRYQNTVTKGVVSGLGRAVDESDLNIATISHNWIQTDAAINLGNSGGPLINLAGEVVGMDTLIDTAGSSLGFAIPINMVKDSVDQLKTFGKVSRPFLGVQFLTIDAKLQLSKNLSVKDGALIGVVSDNSPASRAGLAVGDIVTAVNNVVLNQQNPLDAVIQKYQAGNQVILKVLRNGQTLELPIIVGERQ